MKGGRPFGAANVSEIRDPTRSREWASLVTSAPRLDRDPGGEAGTLRRSDAARWCSNRIEGGLRELPLRGPEVMRAVTFGREDFHNDPTERFIVATALRGGTRC